MKRISKGPRTWFLSVFLWFASLAAVFYLFVVTAMVADNATTVGPFAIGFAIFLYAQLWVIVADYAFQAAAAFYGWKRRVLLVKLWERIPLLLGENSIEPGAFPVFTTFLSYALTIYGFGLAYIFLSHLNPLEFHPAVSLGFLDSMYFSVVTSATVGYGDIVPAGAFAKLLVMAEVMISLFYVVLLFSAVAGHMRKQP